MTTTLSPRSFLEKMKPTTTTFRQVVQAGKIITAESVPATTLAAECIMGRTVSRMAEWLFVKTTQASAGHMTQYAMLLFLPSPTLAGH